MVQVRTTLGKVGFTPKGAWTVEGKYERLDIVSFQGSSFISLADNNTLPLTDATKWMVIAGKGSKGDPFTYEDFTVEQLAKLKGDKGDPFTYDDFTLEQIDDFKQPATEAAMEARNAAAEAKNVPKIQDGTFWVYDPEQKKYVDTGSSATGKSPKAIDDIWWEWNDEAGEYVSTNISANSDYELTKGKVENVLTGDITSHSHATQLAEALANYVQVVAGKQLSTEDFTTELKNKLAGITAGANNYVHPTYQAAGSGLYKITVDAAGHVAAAVPITKADITALGIPGQDTNTVYTHPGYTARASGLYKVTVDATGHVSAVAAVTKADITALGIPAQDTNTTYGLSTQSANGLMSSADKKKLDRIGSKTTATTVASLDVNYETILVTLSANASLSANLTGANYDGWETHVFVLASGADRTVTIPTTGSYISMCGSSVTIASGKWAEFSLKCIGSIWHIALLEQE